MDLKREKRRVYLRCFALLLALWLALLGAFSAYMLANARRQERQRFKDNADALGEALQVSSKERRFGTTYSGWLNTVWTHEGTKGIAAALYTAEGELEWHTDPAGQWTVFLSNSTRYWSMTDGTVDITRWFSVEGLQEITAAAQAQGLVSMSLVLEDVILTADGEVVPRSLALRTSGGDTVLTIFNDSYDQGQYRGTTYASGYIYLSIVRPADALAAAANSQVVRALQTIATDPSVLRAPGADYPRYLGGDGAALGPAGPGLHRPDNRSHPSRLLAGDNGHVGCVERGGPLLAGHRSDQSGGVPAGGLAAGPHDLEGAAGPPAL